MWNTKTNDYKYHIYLRKMKKLAMDRYGSIDIGGYVEYMSNLGKMAQLGFKFTEEDLLSGNPWKVEKPDTMIVNSENEESAITGESSFRVIRPYEDL